MAELADALDLGSSGNPVQVRFLLRPPNFKLNVWYNVIRHFLFFGYVTYMLEVQKIGKRKRSTVIDKNRTIQKQCRLPVHV